MLELAQSRARLLGQRETHQLILHLFRWRFLIVPLVTLALAVFFIWDPVPWKVGLIASLLLGILLLSVFEYRRVLRNPSGVRTLQLNLMLMVVLQSGMIYVTGGIESPMIVVYVPMALAGGILMPDMRRALPIIALPIAFTLMFALACLYDWFPRAAPAFFEIGPGGWSDKPVYVWTTAGLVILVSLATALVSNLIHRMLAQQVDGRLWARGEAIEALDSRNRELLSVSSTIAHELKNPLASIQGLTQLMLRSVASGSKEAERLEVIRAEIARMGEVLEGFRNFSRPMAALNVDQCRLDKMIGDMVMLHEGLAREKGIVVDLDAPPVSVRCDPQKIKQAVMNLIQNALEASPEGGRVHLGLQCNSPADPVRLLVRDQGPGISARDRDRMFDPGFSTKDGGTGLGLVVARSIALQHGGSLILEDLDGRGAQAVLELPAAPETMEGQETG